MKGVLHTKADQSNRNDRSREDSVSPRELESRFKLVWTRLSEMEVDTGDYLEFGPRHNTSLPTMQRVVNKLGLNVRLLGFEMDEPHSADSGHRSTGHSSSVAPSQYTTLNNNTLNQYYYDKKISIDGSVNTEIFKRLELKKASVIMINCDSYAGARSALCFSAPLIIDHTMIFINNGGEQIGGGEGSAYSTFLTENNHLKSLSFRSYKPNGQIFFVTSTRVG